VDSFVGHQTRAAARTDNGAITFPAHPGATMRIAQFLKSLFATLLILSLAACAPTATKEGTGEYVDDTVITTKVKTALAADPDVKATEVQVETFKGVVQLSGFVSSAAAADKAVSLARGVQGVKEVKNNTVVKTSVEK
jgi:hypothetical protein